MKDLSPWLTSPVAIVKVVQEDRCDNKKKERRWGSVKKEHRGWRRRRRKGERRGGRGQKNTVRGKKRQLTH